MVHLLFSLVLAASAFFGLASAEFTLNSIHNPRFNPNGPAAYAKALSKWGVKIPRGLAKHVYRLGENGVVSAQTQADDREYLTPIGVGTPPQTIILDLDTGSADLWLYSSETDPKFLGNRTRWTPETSSTAHIIPNSSWSITYGDGSYAMGRAWKDTVIVGDIVIPDAVVESAVQVSPSMAQDLVMGGIFGLAYNLESEVHPRQPTVLKTMSPLLKYKVFSTDLKYHADGTYQFGGVDTTKYRGRIHWTPLIQRAEYWQFNFTGLNVAPSNLWYYSQWTAIADTGTTLLMLEDELVEFYYADVPHAERNETTGIWTYPCHTVLPDFNLVIGNFTARIPGKYINYTDYEGSLCMGGLQGNFGSPFAILGDIFLKALYVVWDIGGKRLGFADKPLHL